VLVDCPCGYCPGDQVSHRLFLAVFITCELAAALAIANEVIE
jgi:hypothetical protein